MNTVVDVVRFEVERGKIREFARATAAEDGVYTDPDVARSRGHADVAATPTYVAVSLHYRDQQAWVTQLGLDIERTVVGSVSWTYHRVMVVGDALVGTRRVIDDATKQGRNGPIRILTLETQFVDRRDELVATETAVVIDRPVR